MEREEEKIQFDEPKYRDYKTLSPSKKANGDTSQSLEDKKVDKDIVEGNFVDEKTFDGNAVDAEAPPKKRVPRRILHFSDGILEEYSTDEDEVEERKQKQLQEVELKKKQSIIDPKSLSWIPWMLHYTWFAGSTVFTYCDLWGEKLAWFFGITSPKYYYELEEFKRMEEEEADRKTKLENEMHGWVESNREQEVVGTVPAPKSESNS